MKSKALSLYVLPSCSLPKFVDSILVILHLLICLAIYVFVLLEYFVGIRVTSIRFSDGKSHSTRSAKWALGTADPTPANYII